MPYINSDDRNTLDQEITKLVSKLNNYFDEDDIEGALNYSITRVLNETMIESIKDFIGWRYRLINRAIGVLECVKFEFYRRLAAPYEDKAIEKNGDIECYI